MSHACCTNQRPFGCLILPDLSVMLCAMPGTARIGGVDELLDRQFAVVSRAQRDVSP